METRQIILGGGTFEPVRNHFALSAPAFGKTAIALHRLLPDSELFLTRMADRDSEILTNTDASDFVDMLLMDTSVKVIVLNIAFCDFRALPLNGIDNGLHSQRLQTSDGGFSLQLEPTEKVISKIKKVRPDIFLVGFKTTTGKTTQEQLAIAQQMQQNTRCNMVLANDTVERHNLLIDETGQLCFETSNRGAAIQELATLIQLRELVHQNFFAKNDN